MENNKRGKQKRRKIPGATVAIYAVMVFIILGICAVVFFINFNALNKGSSSGGNSSVLGSYILPNDEIIAPSSSPSSSGEESTPDEESSSVGEGSHIDQNSSSPNLSSGSSSSSSSSSSKPDDVPPEIIELEGFSKAFFKDDLFIGDSIFTGLYLYGHIKQENVAAKVGYTPYGAVHSSFDKKGISAVEYAKQRSPKRIFIMLGSNAISSATEINALKNSYSNLLTTLKSELPDSQICCISITPVARKTDYPNVKNSNVRAVNEYIEQQCEALGVGYYDLCSVVSDEDGYFMYAYAEVDGLHFKSVTYSVLLSALQKKYS